MKIKTIILLSFLSFFACKPKVWNMIHDVDRCVEEPFTYTESLGHFHLGKDCEYVALIVKHDWKACPSAKNKYLFNRDVFHTLKNALNCYTGVDSSEIIKIFGEPTVKKYTNQGYLEYYSYELYMADCTQDCYGVDFIFKESSVVDFLTSGQTTLVE